MGDRYYIDKFGERQSYHRDMLQMQREQRKVEARAQRDSYRDKTQKAKDELFKGNKREITKSTTRDNKQENGAKDDVKVHKKDQKPNSAANSTADLLARIVALENRLNAASINANCNEGNVTVTLNI